MKNSSGNKGGTMPNVRDELLKGVVPQQLDRNSPYGEVTFQFLKLLLNHRPGKAYSLLVKNIRNGTPLREIYTNILKPSQYEVGLLWENNSISVEQEHYCTAETEKIIARLHPYVIRKRMINHRFMITCVMGERHSVGTAMISDIMEEEGWQTYLIEPVDAIDQLIEFLIENRIDVLAISTAMTFNFRNLIAMIQAVKSDPRTAHIRTMVGGYVFLANPSLWKLTGADAYVQNVEEVIKTANWFEGV